VHVLPPIKTADQEIQKIEPESLAVTETATAETVTEALSDEESEEEEEEEEELIPAPLGDLDSAVKINFPPLGDPNSIFPATIYQRHTFLDYQKIKSLGHSHQTKNIVRAFSIRGPVDTGVLKRCLSNVSQLHPLLKAKFIHGEEVLYLQISEGEPALHLTVHTLQLLNLDKTIGQEVHRPFELVVETLKECEDNINDLKCHSKYLSIMSLNDENGTDEIGVKPTVTQSSRGHNQCCLPSNAVQNCGPKTYLFRSQLFSHGPFDHTLILTFPRIVCDFYSASLFIRQLASVYSVEEYRPSKDSSIRNKALLKRWSKNFLVAPKPLVPVDSNSQKNPNAQGTWFGNRKRQSVLVSSQLKFKQIALRELELERSLSNERLWSLWWSSATKTVKTHQGQVKVKPVPYVKLPAHLRNQGGTQGQASTFKFLKVEEEAAEKFLEAFPHTLCPLVAPDDFLYFTCLGCYAILLARCCRGWNGNYQSHPHSTFPIVHEDGLEEPRRQGSVNRRPSARQTSARLLSAHYRRSRLMSARSRDKKECVMLTSPPGSGHFLIGTELSLRNFTAETDGLFGPLTNGLMS
jgi:hypothetical protein